MRFSRDDKIKAIRNRLKRGKGIAGKDSVSACSKALEHFTDDELYELGQIYAPVLGLSTQWFKRALIVMIATLPEQEDFGKAMRALLINAMNVWQMKRRQKDFLIRIISGSFIPDHSIDNNKKYVKGPYYPSDYYGVAVIGKGKIYEDYAVNNPKVDYKAIFEHMNKTELGDYFVAAKNSKYLGEKETEYLQDILVYSKYHANAVVSLTNGLVNSKANLRSSTVGEDGKLSQYSQAGIEKKNRKKYRDIYSKVVMDVAVYTQASVSEVVKLGKEIISDQKKKDSK